MIATTGYDGPLVRTGGTAGTAVIGIVAVDVDAQILLICRTNRFFCIGARCQDAFSVDTVLEFRTRYKTAARRICPTEFGARVRIDTRTAANHFTGQTRVFTFALGADFYGPALMIDGTAGIVGVFLTDRPFLAVAVKDAVQMVSCRTVFGETLLANAAGALHTRHRCAVIRVGAAVGHVIDLASFCKEMLCVLAFDITRAFFGIAFRTLFASLARFPVSRHAFGKYISVAFPCVIRTFRFVNGSTRFCFGVALRIIFTGLNEFPFFIYTFGKYIAVAFPCIVCTFGRVIGNTRFFFDIALRIVFTSLNEFPFSRYTFRKCITVTFPGIDI